MMAGQFIGQRGLGKLVQIIGLYTLIVIKLPIALFVFWSLMTETMVVRLIILRGTYENLLRLSV
jgi:hypothetical protein